MKDRNKGVQKEMKKEGRIEIKAYRKEGWK